MPTPRRTLSLSLVLGAALGAPAQATFGSDVLVGGGYTSLAGFAAFDFAPDGTGFIAIPYVDGGGRSVDVYRSGDDGETWQLIDTLALPGSAPGSV